MLVVLCTDKCTVLLAVSVRATYARVRECNNNKYKHIIAMMFILIILILIILYNVKRDSIQ